ncbi:hypothetical protein KSP39_PZI011099 [Platanthera zijinensis]|uniref:Uncharacterized protein n=1 Tax=Platanthera zijinensis TaxID=2320716 RepID=A0AAP0BGL9_9ASPA
MSQSLEDQTAAMRDASRSLRVPLPRPHSSRRVPATAYGPKRYISPNFRFFFSLPSLLLGHFPHFCSSRHLQAQRLSVTRPHTINSKLFPLTYLIDAAMIKLVPACASPVRFSGSHDLFVLMSH